MNLRCSKTRSSSCSSFGDRVHFNARVKEATHTHTLPSYHTQPGSESMGLVPRAKHLSVIGRAGGQVAHVAAPRRARGFVSEPLPHVLQVAAVTTALAPHGQALHPHFTVQWGRAHTTTQPPKRNQPSGTRATLRGLATTKPAGAATHQIAHTVAARHATQLSFLSSNSPHVVQQVLTVVWACGACSAQRTHTVNNKKQHGGQCVSVC